MEEAINDVCFCSLAFGQIYINQQDRLRESILKIYPKANLLFYRGTWPAGAKSFYESLYGFKPHVIKEAKDAGFSKVVFLDPAMILVDKIDDLFNFAVVAVRDDNKLHDLISERCMNFYGLTRERIKTMQWHLVGGSLYYFDFDKKGAFDVFSTWFIAEKEGLFGSQQEQASESINGHRMDETCMALAMYFNNVDPQGADKVRYCQENNPMFIKKHFK
jgi:hypothetical protein